MGIAPQPGDFLPLWVQDHRDRQAEHPHLAGDLLVDVAVLRQVGHADLLEEPPDRLRRVAPGGQRDHREILAAQFTLQGLQRWHFLAAGRAPGRPEIQHDVPARIVGQRPLGLVGPQEGQA